MITIVVSTVVVLSLAVFFWFWWSAPRNSVPIHSSPDELRRLEVQDRLRQTNYQVLTAVGLAATFIISLAQFFETRTHWEADFRSKAEQDRLSTFMNAVKLIKDDSANSTESSTTEAGVRTLGSLGINDPSARISQATEILSNFVINQTRSNEQALGLSVECSDRTWTGTQDLPKSLPQTRPEANSAVQAAMRTLGDKKMSAYRRHQTGAKCTGLASSNPQLRLEHASLDNLDLSGTDLSCSMLSQAKFRRVSLNGANLAFSDLRGARFADYDIQNSPSQRADSKSIISGKLLYSKEWEGGPPEWEVYRCWVSDLRYANLTGSQLEGTALDGADLREATFTGARFSKTDLSRANLTGAYGLTIEMLKHSCAGVARTGYVDVSAQPTGLSGWTDGRLTPCYIDDDVPIATTGEDKVRKEDLPTREVVEKTDIDSEKRLAGRSFWSVFVENYWQPIGQPLAAVLGALLTFELVGRLARRSLVPRGGIFSTLPARFPEKSLRYSANQLAAFTKRHPDLARMYRIPILFPLDFIVMCLLATASGYASWTWLSLAGMSWPIYCLILPVLYWIADFTEDVALFRYLGGARFNEITIGHLKQVTLLKLVLVSLMFIQIPVCFGFYVLDYF
jgi:hypothetical protein